MADLVKFEIEGLKELQKVLDPKKFMMITNRVVNDVAKKFKTETIKEIRKKYNISAERIRKNVDLKSSNYQTLTAQIVFKGRTPGLQHYKMRQIITTKDISYLVYSTKHGIAGKKLKRRRKATKVTVEVIKGKRVEVKKGFILYPKHGGWGIFKRIHKGKGGIIRLFGPSPRGMAKQIGVEKVYENVLKKYGVKFLERAMKRYFRKW